MDRWINAAKNHPVSATFMLGAAILAGATATMSSLKEAVDILIPQPEGVSAVFLDHSPTSPRNVQLLVHNAGTEAAAIQHVVFSVEIKPEGILKKGFAVFFPLADSKSIAGKTSSTLQFEPAAEGMFLLSEPGNSEFVDFFKNIGKSAGLNQDHFRRRWMEKASCSMSANIKSASGDNSDIFPEVTCVKLWPLIQAEFARQ